tara:strand:+ start:4815 stop:5045 length:231 start_codon:yes stop_codon:yes gene_type:complete
MRDKRTGDEKDRLKAAALLASDAALVRLYGGVVTQRIANPRTPVRFRVEPPDPFPVLSRHFGKLNAELRNSSAFHG